MQVQSCMPHELLGLPRTDVSGILLSMQIISEVNSDALKHQKNPKRGKQAARQSAARRKSGTGRKA